MRPTWKGHLSIGALTIPVQMYPAVREHDTRFHQLHLGCGARVRYRRVCPVHDRELAPHEIARGVEVGHEEYVTLTDDELACLPLPTAHAIHIEQFVPAGSLPALRKQKPVYLSYGEGGETGYSLLVRAMQRLGVAAIGKVAMRGNEQLVAVEPYPGTGTLVCWYLLWADELTAPDALAVELVDVKDRDLALACQMVEGYSEGPGLDALADESEAALQALIAAKAEDRAIEAPEAILTTNAADLMETIRRNLEALKAGKGAA